jgi:signal transduction histidine kinase
MNVISNAIDALEEYNCVRSLEEIKASPGKVTIRTSVSSELEEPHKTHKSQSVVIQIADNGPGMPQSLQSQIFDPFFTTKPVGKGTGLGLSISYQIVVEKHGGIFKCISQPGEGTEFWIEIPTRQL